MVRPRRAEMGLRLQSVEKRQSRQRLRRPKSSRKYGYPVRNETIQLTDSLQVFLASERTFFSWLRVALLLGSFALALFNGGDKIGRQMGIVYALISILAVCLDQCRPESTW